jgi:putative spermidine/putrescine transport system permease protein
VFVVMKATLSGVDRSLEEAAAGLGASPVRVFFEVTLPLVGTGVFVGVLFAFIISVNEFIMALFLGTADVKTLPVAIWPKIRYLLTPIVAAASSIIIVITVAMLVLCARLINIRRLLEYK